MMLRIGTTEGGQPIFAERDAVRLVQGPWHTQGGCRVVLRLTERSVETVYLREAPDAVARLLETHDLATAPGATP